MDNKSIEYLREAVGVIGLQPTGAICDVSWQAVAKWLKVGLPRTDWTGETDYAERIASRATELGVAVTAEQLLADPPIRKRPGFQPGHRAVSE